MAFDSTPSSPTANSYVSVQQAEDYFLYRNDSSLWPTATLHKQQLLVTATRRLQSERFRGNKTVATQSLMFPMYYIIDSMGYELSSTTIPTAIIEATCELAYSYLITNEFSPAQLEHLDSYSASVGNISESYTLKKQVYSDLPTVVKIILEGCGFWVKKGSITSISR